MKRTKGIKRSALAAALLMAGLGSSALAQDSGGSERERALEARVAELERLVQSLVAQQQQAEGRISEAEARATEASEKVAAMPAANTTLTPSANPGTKFSFGGFVKSDFMYTDTDSGELADGSVGRLFYVPSTIPVGGDEADEGSADLDVHAQFSRMWFATNTELDSGDKLRSYFEFDLFGNANGNELSTNTYGLTIRHAFFGWNNWLAGQTWSNFQDVAALPDAIDFVGPTEGTIFVRQAQLRYTSGPWSVSAENPETLLTNFGGAGRTVSDDNNLPDFTVRYMHRADWGHFTVAGLLRQLKFETPAGGDSTSAAAISASGLVKVGEADDIRWMLNYGALGRYVGFGLNTDGALEENGDIDAIDGLTGYIAYRHVFDKQLRGNLFYSFASYDNPIAFTGTGVTESANSFHANLIWSPLPKVDLGVELIFGQRELESGVDGELRRLHFHAKYSF